MKITSTYKKFLDDLDKIYREYGDADDISFGVLCASYNQTEAREYIYEFLDDFDEQSGDYYDFFIPGFQECKEGKEPHIVLSRTGKAYRFERKVYKDFCDDFFSYYGIHKTYNPILVLMSVNPGRMGEAQYIVIELDTYNSCGVKRSGELFDQIFEVAKKEMHVKAVKNSMIKSYIKGNWINSMVNVLSGDLLEETQKIGDELKRYRVRSNK